MNDLTKRLIEAADPAVNDDAEYPVYDDESHPPGQSSLHSDSPSALMQAGFQEYSREDFMAAIPQRYDGDEDGTVTQWGEAGLSEFSGSRYFDDGSVSYVLLQGRSGPEWFVSRYD